MHERALAVDYRYTSIGDIAALGTQTCSKWASTLPDPYRSRCFDSSRTERARLESFCTGLLLSDLLSEHTGYDLAFSEWGRPLLQPQDTRKAFIALSVSHGGDIAIMASCANCHALGVDVEPRQPYNPAVARRVFDCARIAWIEADPDACDARFTQAWTELEAVLKAWGTGFSRDPREHDVFTGISTSSFELQGHTVSAASILGTPSIGSLHRLSAGPQLRSVKWDKLQ